MQIAVSPKFRIAIPEEIREPFGIRTGRKPDYLV
jgi:bifunctional DNA-binding transcriptional regulator/antitoxin component of YhaV-PrlF toxin-antitoxin module